MRFSLRNRSFFVGPTLLRHHERRRYWRVLANILMRGNTEPTELFLCATLLLTGITQLVSHQKVYLHSPFWGWSYVLLAVVGIYGLVTRRKIMRMWFGFGTFYVRTWITTLAFAANPGDLFWCGGLIGALMGAWIFLRYWCAIAVARERNRRLKIEDAEQSKILNDLLMFRVLEMRSEGIPAAAIIAKA